MLPTPWLLAAPAVGAGVHLTVAALLLLRDLDSRERHVAWWAGAYALLAAHVLVDGALSVDGSPDLLAVRHLLFTGAGLLVAFSPPLPRRWQTAAPPVALAALAVAAAPSLLDAGGPAAWLWQSLGASLIGAVAFGAGAVRHRLRDRDLDEPGSRLVFWGFLATALLSLAYPLLRLSAAGSAAWAGLASAAALAVGAGVALQMFERRRELRTLNELAVALNRARDQAQASQAALAHAVSLMGVESGWVFLTARDRPGYVVGATERLPAALARDGLSPMRGECRCLQMLSEGRLRQPINLVECLRMERAGLGRPLHATIPLQTRDRTYGLMNLVLPAGRRFSPRELDLLSSVGHLVGLTLERGRLFEEVQETERARRALLERLITAEEDERRRIARELHDQAGQGLTAMILNLELARGLPHDDGDRLDAHFTRLKDIAEGTLQDIRRVIYDLRPSILDDLGLVAAIEWFLNAVVRPAGLDARAEVIGLAGRLPPLVETTLFRLAQEALTNVLRHAEATAVTVRIARESDVAILTVRDDGRGFEPAEVRTPTLRGGLGLHGMQERAALVGGRLVIESTPGSGTVVQAWIPLEGASGDGEDPGPDRR